MMYDVNFTLFGNFFSLDSSLTLVRLVFYCIKMSAKDTLIRIIFIFFIWMDCKFLYIYRKLYFVRKVVVHRSRVRVDELEHERKHGLGPTFFSIVFGQFGLQLFTLLRADGVVAAAREVDELLAERCHPLSYVLDALLVALVAVRLVHALFPSIHNAERQRFDEYHI